MPIRGCNTENWHKFCACVGWRRLLYNSVEQRRDSACQCRGSVLEKGAGWAISGLRSVAHAYDTYGVCTMPTLHVHHLAVYLRWFTDDWAPADTRAWLRIFEQEVDSWQPTDGRGCGEKVTRWPPGNVRPRTLTYAYRRLPTLTDADSRCGAFAPSACARVNPYPSVTGPLSLTSVVQAILCNMWLVALHRLSLTSVVQAILGNMWVAAIHMLSSTSVVQAILGNMWVAAIHMLSLTSVVQAILCNMWVVGIHMLSLTSDVQAILCNMWVVAVHMLSLTSVVQAILCNMLVVAVHMLSTSVVQADSYAVMSLRWKLSNACPFSQGLSVKWFVVRVGWDLNTWNTIQPLSKPCTQCSFHVGPASQTVGQHEHNIGLFFFSLWPCFDGPQPTWGLVPALV